VAGRAISGRLTGLRAAPDIKELGFEAAGVVDVVDALEGTRADVLGCGAALVVFAARDERLLAAGFRPGVRVAIAELGRSF